ncbi:MAG: alpha/beta hydrolase [Chloroflexota bacterium]
MASPQMQTILEMLKNRPLREDVTVQQTRAGFEMIAQLLKCAADVTRTPADADGVSGEWITTSNSSDQTTIYYLHGGGYSIGSLNTHADLVSRIARASGARAFSLDYRLAPENPFPAAVDDATTAFRWLLKQGIRPETIVIAGDSAGGGLAAATMLALQRAGDPLPGGAVLLSPWTDLAATGESVQTRAALDPMIKVDPMNTTGKMYAGEASLTDPLVSPLYGDYSALPPMLIQVGDHEVLLSDATRYAEKAQAAGVDVTIEVFDEMIHVFQIFAGMLPEAQQAIDKIGEWVKQHVSAGATV